MPSNPNQWQQYMIKVFPPGAGQRKSTRSWTWMMFRGRDPNFASHPMASGSQPDRRSAVVAAVDAIMGAEDMKIEQVKKGLW